MIANGPGYAGGATAGGSMPTNNGGTTGSVLAQPTLSYTPGVSLASSETYVPGAIFAITKASFSDSTPTATAAPTNSASVAGDNTEGGFAAAGFDESKPSTTLISTPSPTATVEGIYSTEYVTSGREVYENVFYLKLITTTATATPTPDTAAAGRKRHLHAHRRGVRA